MTVLHVSVLGEKTGTRPQSFLLLPRHKPSWLILFCSVRLLLLCWFCSCWRFRVTYSESTTAAYCDSQFKISLLYLIVQLIQALCVRTGCQWVLPHPLCSLHLLLSGQCEMLANAHQVINHVLHNKAHEKCSYCHNQRLYIKMDLAER